MDSTNNNPTITPAPSPEPQASGAGQPNPVASPTSAPILEPLTTQQPVTQAQPVSGSPVQATPTNTAIGGPVQVAPSSVPGASTQPVAPVNPPLAAPVNPIINPGATSSQNGLGATDAILRPDPIPEPDPVEEELKAPMRAAAPAPGSIGSAVSGPTSDLTSTDAQTPSVSFNDPATQPAVSSSEQLDQNKASKKSSRKTLIALIIVAAMVVIALGAILVMQFIGVPSPDSGTSGNVSNGAIAEPEQKNAANGNTTPVTSSLSCTRAMTSDELVDFENAVAGSMNITAKFSSDKITMIAIVKTVEYDGEGDAGGQTIDEVAESVKGDEITATNAATYYLSVGDDGVIDLTKSGLQKNYELLDFACEVL